MVSAAFPAHPRNWIAVACAGHARCSREERQPGFMQVCHRKLGLLRDALGLQA